MGCTVSRVGCWMGILTVEVRQFRVLPDPDYRNCTPGDLPMTD